jgi:inorganic pyrophosphatase
MRAPPQHTAHPRELDVVIDTPRLSILKRKDDGSIDYVSPLPCPFNYGSVPDTVSGDGDRLDAVVLGPRLARGARVHVNVVALVHFMDAGEPDPKYVCSPHPWRSRDALLVAAFFTAYARLKGALNRLRGERGSTRYQGLERL